MYSILKRDGVPMVAPLCLTLRDDEGTLAAAIRYWPVQVAGRDVLLLGPVAVHPTRQGEGLGGLLGFGKKGGAGFKLIVDTPDADEFAIEIVAGLNSFLEIKGGKNGLLNPKRRRGNANFVWDFRPVEREHVAPLRSRWMKLINEIAETAETAETAQ